jgi:hypothetical protein
VARSVIALALILAACSGEAASSTTTSAPPSTSTTATRPATTTTVETIESCDDVPYRPLVLPGRVAGLEAEPEDLGRDLYTTIPGTAVRIWVDEDLAPIVVLIRGALPPEPWSGPTARIEVVGEDAALGPLPGDRWAVAWFESDDRCDLYTLVISPPTSAEEALEVAESLIPDR